MAKIQKRNSYYQLSHARTIYTRTIKADGTAETQEMLDAIDSCHNLSLERIPYSKSLVDESTYCIQNGVLYLNDPHNHILYREVGIDEIRGKQVQPEMFNFSF